MQGTALPLLCLILASPVALADKGGNPHGRPSDPPPARAYPGAGEHGRGPGGERSGESGAVGVRFSSQERQLVLSYLRDTRYAPEPLPPGIAKNLARGKALPPGIAKRYPPQDLLVRLPQRPGYEYLIAGRDLLLVAAATGVIVDVLREVID